MSESLAIKYRPKIFDDVVEQSATTTILKQQLLGNDIKNAYLFCGGAGTGKTTCARIFANEINDHIGTPIELDAASNNSVDDVRSIIQQAKTASIDSKYKVFIMDEVHALSNNAWQAMLKLLEEPPMRSVFIMCTTDPQKIPKTILSRVQRFDFRRISQQGIVDRLISILAFEQFITPNVALDKHIRPEVWKSVEYIAKIADGGMRDAITMLDKCLAYSSELTMDNVLTALGVADYETMMDFINAYVERDIQIGIATLNKVYMSGKDLKQFIKSVTDFTIDIYKYKNLVDFKYLNCPDTDAIKKFLKEVDIEIDDPMLKRLIKLNQDIKWDTNPKARIEAWFITGE